MILMVNCGAFDGHTKKLDKIQQGPSRIHFVFTEEKTVPGIRLSQYFRKVKFGKNEKTRGGVEIMFDFPAAPV
jgi:hypothetical protein